MGYSQVLKYGKKSLVVECPAETAVASLSNPAHRPLPPGGFKELASATFASIDAGRRADALVVVADKTRLCGYPKLLPELAEALTSVGIPRDSIRFIIAYGTHARQADDESRKSYGKVFDEFEFIHHDCDNESLFESLGATSKGTPIRMRRNVLNASLLVTFGAVSRHYFAGYGGGGKLLFPGLGARSDIERNHSLFLDFDVKRLNPRCAPGVLDGNPVAEDIAEIAAAANADIAFHGIPDASGEVVEVIPGRSRSDFLRACAAFDAVNSAELEGQAFDAVVASAGGYPKDINLIQTHKALRNAAEFLKPGGRLLMLAECRDGIGSKSFAKYIAMGRDAAFDVLAERYEGNGGTALSILSLADKFEISMVTSLDPGFCAEMGIDAIPPENAAVAVQQILTSAQKSALIPNASAMFPSVC